MEDHPAVTASQRTQHQEDMEDTLAALPAAPSLAVAADDQRSAGVNVAKENLIRNEDIVLKETLERIHMKMVKLQRKLGVMCAPLIQNDPRYVGSDKPWTEIKWPKNAYGKVPPGLPRTLGRLNKANNQQLDHVIDAYALDVNLHGAAGVNAQGEKVRAVKEFLKNCACT
jgi:hypothetical protein